MPASSFPSAPFPPQNAEQRDALLAEIRGASLVYGPWRGVKKLYKDSESAFASGDRDFPILAALMARFDLSPFVLEKKTDESPAVLRGSFGAMQAQNGVLYALEGDHLVVLDLSAPLEPREIFRWKPADLTYSYYQRMWVEGNRLVYGSAQNLRFFDLSDPRAPRFEFEAQIGNANGISVQGDRIFLSDYEKMRVLRAPTAATPAPTELGTIPFQYAYNLAAKPGLVACSHYGGRQYEIAFFDVSEPSAPIQVSKINATNPSDWQFWGDYLVRIDDAHLVFTDLSTPSKPREIAKIRVNGAGRFIIDGDMLYVSCSSWRQNTGYEHKLRLIDVSQPHSPRLVGEYNGSASHMAMSGGLLYLSSGNGLKILDVSVPSRPQPVGQRPKNVTFAYLKRRARRLLRTLALADEAAFVQLASAFLLEAGAGRDAFDERENWVCAELVFGGGARWHQSSHGRGAYVRAAKFALKNREERAPDAWNEHLDAAQQLWQHPHLPWQTQEMARKILLANRAEVSAPTVEQLARFGWSNSPALLVFTAREGRNRLAELVGNDLAPRVLAPLLWISTPSQRREILAFLEENPAFKAETASHLATLLGQNSTSGLARRGRDIALLLAARFDLSDSDFRSDGAFDAIPALISSAEAPIRALGLDFCRRLSAPRALDALQFLPQIPAQHRENFIAALCESASRGAIDVDAIEKSVRDAEITIRESAWRLISASQTANDVLRVVWTKLFTGLRHSWNYDSNGRYQGRSWSESTALQTAVHSDAALLTLGRCGLTSESVMPRFNPSFYTPMKDAISPAMWGAYSLVLPASKVVEVVLNAPGWNLEGGAWRDAWARANAPHPTKLAAFWNAVQEFLSSKADESQKEILRGRTFAESVIAATFGGAASQLSPALLMSLIGAVPDALWATWRASLLQTLQTDAVTREAFWSAARESPALESGFLRARLIEDADFAATFGLLETDALEADNPAFTPLLLAWLQSRGLDSNRAIWIEAATHPLPAVRDFGLSRLEILGLDVPGALRLLESRLPPSIAFGRNWFENQGESQLNLALALSDSPQPSVRAFGRDYIASRLEVLMSGGLIGYLQDNPNAEMQAFVAAQLQEKPELAAPEFDRAVLRSRYRARHAKTLVQERRTSSAPLPDDKTLLELARGRTARDREWALSQLARRALEGNVVEGVEVGEVVGV